jgi:hypothetical protein
MDPLSAWDRRIRLAMSWRLAPGTTMRVWIFGVALVLGGLDLVASLGHGKLVIQQSNRNMLRISPTNEE